MRWIALWLFLTVTYAAGWLVTRLCLGEPLQATPEALAHLAFVPPAQVLALAMLRIFRRP
jgi:hypothetical protein